MQANNPWKKVIWAIDPFLGDRKLQVSAGRAAKALTRNTSAEVEPVFVLNQYPANMAINTPLEIEREMREAAQDEVNRMVAQMRLPHLLPVKALTANHFGQRGATQALIAYAQETDANAIVVSTHARKGLDRWLMGSFTEELMLHSDIPLFIVNPRWKSTTGIKHILFPTDFLEGSESAMGGVISLAQVLKADITLYHQTRFASYPGIQSAFSIYPLYREAFEAELASAREKLSVLSEKVKTAGIRVRTHIDTDIGDSTGNAILRFARGKQFLIAMAARSGRIEAGLLGSTTRYVARGSNFPVWIIHPQGKGLAQAIESSPLQEKVAGSLGALQDILV